MASSLASLLAFLATVFFFLGEAAAAAAGLFRGATLGAVTVCVAGASLSVASPGEQNYNNKFSCKFSVSFENVLKIRNILGSSGFSSLNLASLLSSMSHNLVPKFFKIEHSFPDFMGIGYCCSDFSAWREKCN